MERRAQIPPLALAAAAWALLVLARVLTLAIDPWEWDEILFVRSVRLGLDLRAGRPHAPGYPLFVEAARGIAAFGVEPFRAATLTGFAGGILAPLGLATLLAAFGAPLFTRVLGAALYGFVPAVWLHGGRPLSDAPAAAAFLFAAASLLFAIKRKSTSWLMAGALASAVTFGLRPQTAIALLPLAAFAAFRFLREHRIGVVAGAFGLGLAASALAYVPVVQGSGGWNAYRDRVLAQARYVHETDSLSRTDLVKSETWTRWFRDPFGPDVLALAYGVLCVLALVFCFRHAIALAALFAPLFLVTIAWSSLPAAPRYAVVLLPLPAALAALAIERLRGVARVPAVLCGVALVGASALAAAPAVLEVAHTQSPAVAAFRALREDPALSGRPLVIWTGLALHQSEFLPGARVRLLAEDKTSVVARGEMIVMSDDAIFGQRPMRHFTLENPLLLRISRARYLNVSIVEGDPGLGVLRLWLDGRGEVDWATGNTQLLEGDVLTVRGVSGPVTVTCGAEAGRRAEAHLRVTTQGPSRRFSLPSRSRSALAFVTLPDAGGVLFRIRAEEGNVALSDFRFTPTEKAP